MWIVAVLFLGMGALGLVSPTRLVAPFGIELTGADARSEVRAVYGGFGIAVGAVLITAAQCDDTGWRHGVATAIGVALAGMAFGRLISRLRERPGGFYPVWFYFWVEVVLAGLLFASTRG